MLFWIVIGGGMMLISFIMLMIRHFRKEKHRDSYVTNLFGWPTFVSGMLMMVPTFIWYDFLIGFVAMAAYEGWQFIAAKRKIAEHELSKVKGETA